MQHGKAVPQKYPKMKRVLVTLEKIKDIQMQLQASDQPNIGWQIIQLLYTNETLNDATGTAYTFASAFCNKLAHCIDKQDIIVEWATAAILDPR